jgi:hypothetical protein
MPHSTRRDVLRSIGAATFAMHLPLVAAQPARLQ